MRCAKPSREGAYGGHYVRIQFFENVDPDGTIALVEELSATGPEIRKFFDERNRSIRIDVFEELNSHIMAAIRSFTRRLGAPHLLDEVILPTLQEGDSQILTA